MQEGNSSFITETDGIKLKEVACIPISLYKSLQGRYFVGQTEALWVGDGANAWASLSNPINSGVDLFVNVITFSNFCDQYLTAEIWLNTKLRSKGSISDKVSPANTALKMQPNNKVAIKFMKSTEEVPRGGVNVFDRIIPPLGTLVSEEDGKFIVPPGGNYTVYIKPANPKLSKVVIAFGWWEEPIKNCD